MLKYHASPDLDRVFRAVGDANRRHILTMLARYGEQRVSDLAEPLAISLPAVSQHISVLVDADLVVKTKRGRASFCRLNPEPLQEVTSWIEAMEKFWQPRLDRLTEYLTEPPSNPPNDHGSDDRPDPNLPSP